MAAPPTRVRRATTTGMSRPLANGGVGAAGAGAGGVGEGGREAGAVLADVSDLQTLQMNEHIHDCMPTPVAAANASS